MAKPQSKWITKKRTNSGIYITIAEARTRKELIDKLKRDSETYTERGYTNGKKETD